MKRVHKFLAILAVVCASSGCTEDFEKFNTSPQIEGSVEPQQLFYRAQTRYLLSGTAWNGIYYSRNHWMQYGTQRWDTSEGSMQTRWTWFGTVNSGANGVYDEYNQIGGLVTNMTALLNNSDNPNRFSDVVQMGRIMLIAKAIQASDLFGSLAYTESWSTRAGGENMTPKFETQQELVDIWERELKECIAKLQANMTNTDKVSLRGIDRSYNGDTQKWIKAANAIRLRLASRIWKMQPTKAVAIATEILAAGNAVNVFSHIDDSFIFWYDHLYYNGPDQGGDWHSIVDLNSASHCMMEYLNKYNDPRRPVFFRTTNITPANIASFNAYIKSTRANPFQLIPSYYTGWEGASVSWDTRRSAIPSMPAMEPGPGGTPPATIPSWGLMPNPANYPSADHPDYKAAVDSYYDNFNIDDLVRDPSLWPSGKIEYDRRYYGYSVPIGANNASVNMTINNIPQVRLWRGASDGGSGGTNTGGHWVPVMTYADFSYLAAEFVLRAGVASHKTAEQWYTGGVRASLEQWSQIASWCKIHDLPASGPAITAAEINAFMAQPDIAWDASKALSQIYAQTYIEHFKHVDESWAFWKRTNFPNPTSDIVKFEEVWVSGIERFIPRKARVNYPDPGAINYENRVKRIDDMLLDPKYLGHDKEFGRLWWDAE